MNTNEFNEFCKGKKVIDKHPISAGVKEYNHLHTEMTAYYDYNYYLGSDGVIYKDSYYIGD